MTYHHVKRTKAYKRGAKLRSRKRFNGTGGGEFLEHTTGKGTESGVMYWGT